MSRSDGFTLIELLIVIVIIGILAAIAIPRFGSIRDRSYYKAMMADLRNLNTQQELYYTRPQNNYTYATSIGQVPQYTMSAGVSIEISESSSLGWAAIATHAALGTHQRCGIVMGTVATIPDFIDAAGVVTCTGQ